LIRRKGEKEKRGKGEKGKRGEGEKGRRKPFAHHSTLGKRICRTAR
jgi:hypothetical protein